MESASTTTTFIADNMDAPLMAGTDTLATASTDAVMKIGDLSAMGLANFTPAGLVERLMEAIHVTTGMPWWATILAATFAARIALVPLNIKTQRSAAKMRTIQPQVKDLMDKYAAAKTAGDENLKLLYMSEVQSLYETSKVKPMEPALAGASRYW
jgi:YidC/Oxa1 family membrane protein insertase